PAEMERKIRRAVTDNDSEVRYDPGSKPGVSNLLAILGAATGRKPTDVAGDYSRYGNLKTDTAAAVVELLRPVQLRYEEISGDDGATEALLRSGADKARSVAAGTLERAQAAIGLLSP
ncbi:MAG: tryptophan--tRNA ligase, partial [Acidimicrobiales bacterium]